MAEIVSQTEEQFGKPMGEMRPIGASAEPASLELGNVQADLELMTAGLGGCWRPGRTIGTWHRSRIIRVRLSPAVSSGHDMAGDVTPPRITVAGVVPERGKLAQQGRFRVLECESRRTQSLVRPRVLLAKGAWRVACQRSQWLECS